MPGYQLAAIDRSRVKKKDLCPKCDGLLREAVQTITCGHRFCKTCFALILSDGEGKCTIDGTVVKEEEVFQDKFVERELQSLVVHCVRNDLGCSWEGELRRREEHDAVCEFGKVPCVHSECEELVTRAELLDHLQSKCNYRMEKCEFCHNPVLFAAMKDHHQSECASVLVSCPECDMQGIPRAQVAAHIDPVIGDCEEVQAPCPMAQIGCSETEVMKLRDRRLHLEKNFPQHLLFVFRLVMGLSSAKDKATDQQTISFHTNGTYLPVQREFERSFKQLEEMTLENRELKSRVQQQEDRIKRLERARHDGSMAAGPVQTESTLREITRRINNEEAKTSDLEVLIVEGHRATEELQREMVKLKREDQVLMETVGGLQRQLDSLQHNSALRNMALADLEEILKQQEVSSHNGVLVWKIPDFARKRQDAATGKATSHYSPIFYTGHHGYKMCARIYLNGDGMGRGTHISVFFVIMRGRFDALLRWPFRQKVTMMLLDQDNVEHVIDAFRPDPNSSSFQRPRREMNVASGCPLFCPLSELSNHAYVRDDAMFIKIIVDTAEL